MTDIKKIIFDLDEFDEFFNSLSLNCSFNPKTGAIYWIDGILLIGEIVEE